MDNNEKPVRVAIEPLFFVLGYVIVLLGLMLFVVPRFMVIFADMGYELPAITAKLLSIRYWVVVPLLLLGSGRLPVKQPQARRGFSIAVHVLGVLSILYVVLALLAGVVAMKAGV